MQILEKRLNDEAVLLTLDGTPLCRRCVAPLAERLGRLAGNGVTRVMVDLSGLDFLGASLVGVLAAGHRALQETGGVLQLTGNTARISRALRVVHLQGILVVSGTPQEAVAEGRGQRGSGSRLPQPADRRPRQVAVAV